MKHDQIKWTKSNSIKSDKNENDQIKKGLNYERIIAQEKCSPHQSIRQNKLESK